MFDVLKINQQTMMELVFYILHLPRVELDCKLPVVTLSLVKWYGLVKDIPALYFALECKFN